MPTCESTGTMHCRVKKGRVTAIFFIPDADHTINKMAKKYAIFLDPKDKEKNIAEELTDDGVSIKTNRKHKKRAYLTAMFDAALKHSKVDVQVKCQRKGKRLNLVGITVPARQSAK